MEVKHEHLQSLEGRDQIILRLEKRGVTLRDIAEIVYQLQSPYRPDLELPECIDSIYRVLSKREMQYAIFVGMELDELAEKGLLSEPISTIIRSDEGLFGIDETLAIGAVNCWGSIAVTTFGYLDKQKIGIIKRLDSDGTRVNTFLDDLVCAIAAAACGKIAHGKSK